MPVGSLPDNRHWQGHRVLAVDGSTLKLPASKECTEEFGEYDMGRGGHSRKTCMGRISMCYDVLHKMVLDDTPDNKSVQEG